MKIDRVTMTGADDSVQPGDLVDLSRTYPFVEWGILFSQKHQGHPRFPSIQWLKTLKARRVDGMLLSGHVCGRYVRDMLDGCDGGSLFRHEMWEYTYAFQRLQWNFHAERFKSINFIQIRDRLERYQQHHIFQADGVNDAMMEILHKLGASISPLFDTSGGAGIVPEKWPAPIPDVYCGYAGGLGPETLALELIRINDVVGNGTIWIDMERRIRSDDDSRFGLDKVEACLRMVQRWNGL